MTVKLTPEQEQAIRNAIRHGYFRSIEDFIDAAIATIPDFRNQTESSRMSAVREMRDFGEKYNLSFGEIITRRLVHEEHRY